VCGRDGRRQRRPRDNVWPRTRCGAFSPRLADFLNPGRARDSSARARTIRQAVAQPFHGIKAGPSPPSGVPKHPSQRRARRRARTLIFTEYRAVANVRPDHQRGVAAERSAQRACERSSDWRRGPQAPPTQNYANTKARMRAGGRQHPIHCQQSKTTSRACTQVVDNIQSVTQLGAHATPGVATETDPLAFPVSAPSAAPGYARPDPLRHRDFDLFWGQLSLSRPQITLVAMPFRRRADPRAAFVG
jgi:hypothetical protein